MKIQFTSLTIEGFRSFATPVTLDLNSPGGLYLISGRNELEPELGGNGVGKSTLFEALFWCLYGKMSNGISAANVSTWGGDHAKVTVCFHIGESQYMLTRQRGPNHLILAEQHGPNYVIIPREVTNEDVVKLLSMSPILASSTFFIGQFAETFLERPNSDRMEMFSQLLAGERWDSYRKSADNNFAKADAEMRGTTSGIQVLRGRIEEISLAKLELMRDQWELGRKAQEADKRGAVAEAALALDIVRAEQVTADNAFTDLSNAAAGQEPAVPRDPGPKAVPTNPQMAVVEKELEELVNDLRHQEVLRNQESAALVQLAEVGPTCNHCGQQVSDDYRKEHEQTHTSTFQNAQTKIVALTAQTMQKRFVLTKLTSEQTKLEQAAKDTAKILYDDTLAKYRANVLVFRGRVSRAQAAESVLKSKRWEVNTKTQELTRLRKELTDLEKQTNPFTAQLADAKTKKASYEKQLAGLLKDEEELKVLVADLEYWKRDGFKRIRILKVQEALKQLEIAVNDGMVQLGLRGWSILLDAERELTSGTVKREFVINVQSPYNTEIVPWDSFSGGERQRLRMAFLFGLQTFMVQRSGIEPSLLFVDEPTTWLSEGGIGDMLAFLAMKAKRDSLQVWLADHRTLDFGDFVGRITVVKTAQGSQLERT